MSPRPTIPALTLTQYILGKCGDMSHLKLQKLLYYIQAWHLAIFGKSVIDDDFKAWVHGPVCVSVWHAVKKYSVLNGLVTVKNGGKAAKRTVKESLHSDQIQLIEDVLGE